MIQHRQKYRGMKEHMPFGLFSATGVYGEGEGVAEDSVQ